MQVPHSRVQEVSDLQILKLFQELQMVLHSGTPEYHELRVLQLLQLFLSPNGGTAKSVKITKEMIDVVDPADQVLLRMKVGKVEDAIHQLLAELAGLIDKSVESFSGTSLVTLNKICSDAEKEATMTSVRMLD